MKKTFFILLILAVISKLFGFSREIFLAFYFGTSEVSDAFNLTNSIPMIFFGALGSALATAYIPFSTNSKTKSEKQSLLVQVLSVYLLISIAGMSLSLLHLEQITMLLGSNLNAEQRDLTNFFLKISMLSVPFVGLPFILASYQQANNHHYSANVIGIPLSIATIIFIFIANQTESSNLAWATPAGYFAQTVFLTFLIFPNVKKSELLENFFDFTVLKKILGSTLIILPTLILVQSNGLVDRFIASDLQTGAISALAFADRVITLFIGVFILCLSSIIFPKLSNDFQENDIVSYHNNLKLAIKVSLITLAPVVVGLTFFNKEVVTIVFYRGSFDEKALQMTSSCLFYYAFGLIFFGVREVLTKSFYAKKSMLHPFIVSAVSLALNFALSLYFSKSLGVGGIALATSITYFLSMCYLVLVSRLRFGEFLFLDKSLLKVVYVFFVSILCALIVRKVLQLIISVDSTFAVYSSCAALYFLATYSFVYLLLRKET